MGADEPLTASLPRTPAQPLRDSGHNTIQENFHVGVIVMELFGHSSHFIHEQGHGTALF
ncbi:hypothetical protein PE067_06815 [Paracoccus sp. DMF-8]|uniref:hypothetical protein n=1 Tax=Paracoccus sp. DMF-8 TaxID=3019445 RepID=UPI0023E8EB4A|nr:hypothetical protein [Paracoccus sp. DMF-8]MDF3605885.1 hypothetical protein [Paracoccus sp. DMF-8]